MVDWKQSLPQIIGALIGSSLLVSGLSGLLRPTVGISVDPYPSDNNVQNMTYKISFKNIGYAPATHLRLTMYYPGAKILHNVTVYRNENMTIKDENPSSVVAFVPRLAPSASIVINNSITRSAASININPQSIMSSSRGSLADYGSDDSRYNYRHNSPYSIFATYDQGSNEAILPETPGKVPLGYPYNTEVYESSILIVLAFLSFAIVVRRRRRSQNLLRTY